MVQPVIAELASAIKIGKFKQKKIFLQNADLTDEDVSTLFTAIRSNPEFRRSLEDINLAGNKIKTVPSLDGFTSLKYLVLRNNEISSLPRFPRLNELYMLDLSNNRMTAMPNLAHLPKLSEIYLQKNPLSSLPQLPRLEQLSYFVVDTSGLKNFAKIIAEQLNTHVPNLFGPRASSSTSPKEISVTLLKTLTDELIEELNAESMLKIIEQITYLTGCEHQEAHLLAKIVPLINVENDFRHAVTAEIRNLTRALLEKDRDYVNLWLKNEAQAYAEKLAWRAFKQAYENMLRAPKEQCGDENQFLFNSAHACTEDTSESAQDISASTSMQTARAEI